MTKLRPALSTGDALARIAGTVPGGYDAMGLELGVSAKAIRNWGDPDRPEEVTIARAIRLDILYRRHGGPDAPLHETYGEQLRLEQQEAFADEIALARFASTAARESGEAMEALILASLPGATEADRQFAGRQVAEALEALRHTLPSLTKRATPAAEAPP